MRKLEKLILDMRKQLSPYHHDHDIETGRKRWDVADGEYLAAWMGEHLRHCQKRNRCTKKGRCAFYTYSDLARKNFEICYEVLLRIENGEVWCNIIDEREDKEK